MKRVCLGHSRCRGTACKSCFLITIDIGLITIVVCMVTIVTYSNHDCRYMAQPGSWGDRVLLKALSYAWGVRITILRALTMDEVRFRHNMPLPGVEFVLIYNGINHYVGAGKRNKYDTGWFNSH